MSDYKTMKKTTKNVFTFGMVLLSSSVFAGGSTSTPEILALRAFSESLVSIEKKDVECNDRKKALPYEEIQALGLSKESLKTALKYHFANASYLCVKPEISEFLLATTALKDLAKETPDTKAFKEGLDGGNNLVITHLTQTFRAKADYLSLPESARKSIEGISALQEPFDLMTAAKALDLFAKQ